MNASPTRKVGPALSLNAEDPRFKDKLKGLGIVTHQDTQRLQQAVGGTAPAGEIKSRTDDVRFNVTLYNVANIQPREAYVLQVVVTDVPAKYQNLLDGVGAATTQLIQIPTVPGAANHLVSVVVSNLNATATNWRLVQGTGANCATAQTNLTALVSFTANTSYTAFDVVFPGTGLVATAGNAVCVTGSAAGSLSTTATWSAY